MITQYLSVRRAVRLFAAGAVLSSAPVFFAQQAPATVQETGPKQHYLPSPAFDASSMDAKADPCNDFYKFACGNFAMNHPIPSDQSSVDEFYQIYNVNAERLSGILTKYSRPDVARTPSQQKIGDYYAACMNTPLIEQKGLSPIQPMLAEIDRVSKLGLPYFAGELQRFGVNVFFSYGEMQDFKDSSKQIAVMDQGGLGLPERDYYTRAGDKDKQLRDQYVEHITKILAAIGEPQQQALIDARNVLAFETKLANASMPVTDRRDPAAIYHPQSISTFDASLGGVPFGRFFEAVHSPQVSSLNVAVPGFFPAMIEAIKAADMPTLKAYLRYHLVSTYARSLPKKIDDENFDFYGRKLNGQPEQEPRWKRCAAGDDGALGEALGQVYVEQYFAGDSKAKTLAMVHDIESAMDRDIDTLDWMSATTKTRAKEKLKGITDKIGYPDHWRDYSKLSVSPDDSLGNSMRANAFENDRQLSKIGQPVDKLEWGMSPPTVNAYYDPSMNNINFPAGILQPAFYDPSADLATNYGHIGAVIGHELTHGFDDEGRKFDAAGNMSDWWTAEDAKKFESRAACLVNEYGGFTAVDDVKVNGKLTLGENTADNGGLVLAYMAYLDRAKQSGIDPAKKIDGYTGPQRFFIGYAQNWCENSRPETVRQQVLTDPHSPDHFRANGAVVNTPDFAPAFGCKRGSAMVPANNCRVW